MKYTEKSDTIIQSPRISQNHLIILIPKIKSISATINHVRFASQIAEKDCVNQASTASRNFLFLRSSSLMRSKMRIFASIAIPSESTRPAIEARVRTIENCLSINNIITTYIKSDIAAISQENLYI